VDPNEVLRQINEVLRQITSTFRAQEGEQCTEACIVMIDLLSKLGVPPEKFSNCDEAFEQLIAVEEKLRTLLAETSTLA